MLGEPCEILICVDCLLLLANGVETDEQRQAAERMSKIWDDTDITLGRSHADCDHGDDDYDECDTYGFSWQSCDGCGSVLGGDRHYATAWIKSEVSSNVR